MNIDLGPLYQVIGASKQELRNIDRKLRHAAEDAAAYEKSTHAYQNRTGNLERSTIGKVVKDGDGFEVSLIMGMEYASYVVGRGFSNVEIAFEMLTENVEDYLSRSGFNL